MNFILTGHKGLIGTFLLRRLTEQGHAPILLIDKRETPSLENPAPITDIANIENHSLSQPVDVFIHLASFCKINKIIENPDLALQNNVLGIHKVMEFCRKNKIPKIVFTSSSRVLSKEKNPYTASKIYGEELVKGYADSYGIEYVIIRPSTVYGPFNDLTKRLVDIFILNALQNKELKIYGDKNKTLDFTYIGDFIEAFLIAMEQKNKEFDIGSGKSTKLEYLADLIIKLNTSGKKSFHSPEIAQPQEVELDISPLKALGYEPKVSIEEGIEKTFRWYKENFDEIIEKRK
ncbi:MAG: NAD-dependent epimerase/dehydratase family protein [Nanoarchaeota archaeon]|nr:NAD-dependent epimerase/dehydratase family protein [Nanoarchaeota archaeon]